MRSWCVFSLAINRPSGEYQLTNYLSTGTNECSVNKLQWRVYAAVHAGGSAGLLAHGSDTRTFKCASKFDVEVHACEVAAQ